MASATVAQQLQVTEWYCQVRVRGNTWFSVLETCWLVGHVARAHSCMHMAGQAGTLSTGHASSAIHMGPMTFTEGSWAAAAVTDTNKLFAFTSTSAQTCPEGCGNAFQ